MKKFIRSIFKKRFILPALGGALLIAGIALLTPYLLIMQQDHAQLQKAEASTTVVPAVAAPAATPTISGTPVHFTLSSVNIDVNVQTGYYNAAKGTWTLGPTDAYYANVTSPANNKTGNTFIYGHNRNQVFTRLLNAQIGDIATVTTDNGYTFTYKLASLADHDPSDTSVLDPTVAPTLSVQTCSGSWYQHRRIYVFNFVEVHKNV